MVTLSFKMSLKGNLQQPKKIEMLRTWEREAGKILPSPLSRGQDPEEVSQRAAV